MTAIVFRTPGSIDVRAFTTMGINAKPNSSTPIGYFGTGLKYAVAVLTRLGATLQVFTGGNRYWFETVPMEFRGAEFQQIVMRRDSWMGGEGWRLGRRVKLPYTTQYGRNWEAWMAFRELYSNTLDEGGEAWEYEPGTYPAGHAIYDPEGEPGGGERTLIVVDSCEPFAEAYRKRGDIFVDLGERKLIGKVEGVELREGQGQQLFYQGLRAKDVSKPTLMTYNFVTAKDLTEDRQLAHEWQVRSALANAIARSDDVDLIERVITADEKHWEHGLVPDAWVQPSAAFRTAMARRPRGVGVGWGGYYGRHDDRPEVVRANLWDDALRPWKVEGDQVTAADETQLFDKPYDMNAGRWKALAEALCRVANAGHREASLEEVLEESRRVAPDLPRDDDLVY